MARLDDVEIQCVKRLAELFQNGVIRIDCRRVPETPQPLNVPPERRDDVLATMRNLGVIDHVIEAGGISGVDKIMMFNVNAHSLQVAREIAVEEKKQREPEDIVTQIKETAKRQRLVAWLIIVFIVMTAVVTFMNNLWQLLERMGVMPTK